MRMLLTYLDLFQYLYLSQIITDANGALVLLKYLTEKFEFLNNTYYYIDK